MTIQTSSSNKNRFLNCFKEAFMRNKSIGIFYFCLSFIFLPVQYILTLERYKFTSPENILDQFLGSSFVYTYFSAPAFFMLTVGMAFAAPIIMFSYMQNKRAVDVYHSLPYTRNELLGAHILSGILYIMIPIAINFSIIALTSMRIPGAKPLSILAEIFYWFPSVIGVFSITTLVCVLVGTTLDSFLFSLGLHITPVVVWMILNILAISYIIGFGEFSLFAQDVSVLSPALIRIPYFTYDLKDHVLPHDLFVNQITISVVWIFISLAVFALAFYCYSKRKSEQAETATEKGALSMLLRLVGTAGGGILLATIFSSTLLDNGPYNKGFLIWTFASSLIVYLVGDVIISKRIRNIKKAVLPGATFSLAVVGIVSCFFFDVAGYNKRLPQRDEIVSVSLQNYSNNYSGRFANQPHWNQDVIEYTSPEVIDAIFEYHKAQTDILNEQGIAGAREIQYYTENFYFTPIEYKLSSGKTMYRNFSWSLSRNCAESIYKLETSPEFIEKNHPIFKMNETAVTAVNTINLTGSYSESLNLSTREISELIAALRSDMLSDGGRDLLNSRPLGKFIFFADDVQMKKLYGWDNERIRDYGYETASSEVTITVTDAFKSTLSLMENLGKEENFRNDIDDIKGAYIDAPIFNSNAVIEINYNTAASRVFVNEPFNISQEELKEIEKDFRGFGLYNVPHLDILFVSNPENLDMIMENTDKEILTSESEQTANSHRATGMAFVPYEKLPDNLKARFLKLIDASGTADDYALSRYGMNREFLDAEMAKYSNLL